MKTLSFSFYLLIGILAMGTVGIIVLARNVPAPTQHIEKPVNIPTAIPSPSPTQP